MPAGVSWATYLKMFAASLLSMCAGAEVVHRYYRPDLVSAGGSCFLAPGPLRSPPSGGSDLKTELEGPSALSVEPEGGIALPLEQRPACSFTGLTQPVTWLPPALISYHLPLVPTVAATRFPCCFPHS